MFWLHSMKKLPLPFFNDRAIPYDAGLLLDLTEEYDNNLCVYTIRINMFIFKWSSSLSQPWQNATLPSFSLLVFPSRSHCSTSQINLHFPSFNVFIWLVTRRFFINKLYLVCSLPLNIPILEYSPSICYSFYFTYPYTHQELINEVNTSCSMCACNNIPSSTC